MKKTSVISALVLVAGLLFSCSKNSPYFGDIAFDDGSKPVPAARTDRTPTQESRRVLILYSAGYNSLAGYLGEDIGDLTMGFLPDTSRNADIMLVISRHTSEYRASYTTPMPTYLIRLTREEGKKAQMDTIKVWGPEYASTSASFMGEALEYVQEKFPAAGYGMIFSSHGSGWLPMKYYSSPSTYDPNYNGSYDSIHLWNSSRRLRMSPPIPSYPAVKSLGQDAGTPYAELELKDMVQAIPIHLDYFIVDACLMGCVEFAYAVKDVCDVVAFSQTEIVADGFNYTTLTSHLLDKPEPDVRAVCMDYFNQYDAQVGQARSATISMINCHELDALADVCASLFDKYRSQIYNLDSHDVQRYFRASRYFFFDLQDILLHCGITQQESAALQSALDNCVLYKAATPQFFGIDIDNYSGLSMYLPAGNSSTPYLNKYYRENISWNTRTGLVQ